MPPRPKKTTKPSAPQSLTFAEKLELQTRPECELPLYLDAAGQQEIEALDAELAGLVAAGDTRMEPNPRIADIASEIRDRQQRMAQSLQVFRLVGLDRKAWLGLCAQHPPRADNELDKTWTVNVDTFFEPLVRASIIDPVMTDEQFTRLLDGLTPLQWDRLFMAAWRLNRRDVSIPLSSGVSQTITRGATN